MQVNIAAGIEFDFSNLSVNNSGHVDLGQVVDTSGYGKVQLAVRVHQITITQTPTLEVNLYPVFPDSAEPPREFVEGTSLIDVNLETLAAGAYELTTRYDGPGAAVAARLIATQDASTAGSITGKISVDVILSN